MGTRNRVPTFKLPRFTAAVDCEPIGYPGLVIHFWLNVTVDPDRVEDLEWVARRRKEEPEATEGKSDGEVLKARPPWDTDYHYGMGRIVDRVDIPGEYTEDGAPAVVPVADGEALYHLLNSAGFEQNIILWASGQYYDLRADRLRAEAKN